VCRHLLIKTSPGRRHQNNFRFSIFDFRFFANLPLKFFDRGKNRLRLHHHPLPSAKRRIISDAMLVRRPIAQVMNVKIDNLIFLRALHDAFAQRRAADFRE
jgi:hypothetical protein